MYQHPKAHACQQGLGAPRHRTLPKAMDLLSATPSIAGQTDISRGHRSGSREVEKPAFTAGDGQVTSSGLWGSTGTFSS